MLNVFIAILPFLVSVNSIVENGVCYKIDNGVRVIEDCPNNILPHLHLHTHPPSSIDDNPTGHEANFTSSTTSSLSPTSTRSSSSDNVSSDSMGIFGGMALGSVFFTFVFLF
jgi:hypothetical protein